MQNFLSFFFKKWRFCCQNDIVFFFLVIKLADWQQVAWKQGQKNIKDKVKKAQVVLMKTAIILNRKPDWVITLQCQDTQRAPHKNWNLRTVDYYTMMSNDANMMAARGDWPRPGLWIAAMRWRGNGPDCDCEKMLSGCDFCGTGSAGLALL